MSYTDIYCAQCGEPWDAYGARNGDMYAWENALFVKGIGCPSCEGDGEATQARQEKFYTSLVGNTEHCTVQLAHALEDGTLGTGKWVCPVPTPIHECAHCEVVLATDAEGNKVWVGGQPCHDGFTYGQAYRHEDADDAEFLILDGETYCPGCATVCSECDPDSQSVLLVGEAGWDVDPDAEGFAAPRADSLDGPTCMDCYWDLRYEAASEYAAWFVGQHCTQEDYDKGCEIASEYSCMDLDEERVLDALFKAGILLCGHCQEANATTLEGEKARCDACEVRE